MHARVVAWKISTREKGKDRPTWTPLMALWLSRISSYYILVLESMSLRDLIFFRQRSTGALSYI